MKRRLLAAAMACLLLAGCGPARTEPLQEEPAAAQELSSQRPSIAYVPLDDRPDNEERVIYLAESLGYTLELPERDLYRTRLDGQPLNENGTQCGDRAALYEWVLEREAAGCDRYVLFIDQLLSGGLVNSRHMVESVPLTLSDGRVLTEFQVLEELLSTLSADESNRVWLLDSVMRLAPTVGYAGFGIEEYEALRAYGIAGRPVLTGPSLTLDNITADYRLGADGAELSLADFGLEAAEAAEYLCARERKLTLSARMLSFLHNAQAGSENFRLLIGIDDSSEEDSIQKNEIAFLRTQLRKGDALLSGVDDLAFKAVAKLFLEEHPDAARPSVAVSYYGGTEDRPACAYDYQPLQNIVAEHMAFFELEEAANADTADIHMLVLTQPADPGRQREYFDALISRLNENEQAQRPTILIDAGNGQYATAFHEALTRKAHLGWLLSYAGFLDMAIVTGTAMSHGVARYVFLREGTQTQATQRAFLRTVADSVLKDFCYKHIVRNDLLAYIQGDLAGSGDNYWQPDIDRPAIQARLESGMAAATEDVIENLERSNFISGLEPYTLQGWGGISLENYRFPWDRAFEIGMDIRLGEPTAPHASVLGIYYQ